MSRIFAGVFTTLGIALGGAIIMVNISNSVVLKFIVGSERVEEGGFLGVIWTWFLALACPNIFFEFTSGLPKMSSVIYPDGEDYGGTGSPNVSLAIIMYGIWIFACFMGGIISKSGPLGGMGVASLSVLISTSCFALITAILMHDSLYYRFLWFILTYFTAYGLGSMAIVSMFGGLAAALGGTIGLAMGLPTKYAPKSTTNEDSST